MTVSVWMAAAALARMELIVETSSDGKGVIK